MSTQTRSSIKPASAWVLAVLATTFTPAQAEPLKQWAGSVLGFSSQYGTGDWSAARALGAPDSPLYGDQGTAWAPAEQNAGQEFISVGFERSIYASGALVREVFSNGFVVQIDAIDAQGIAHTVWSGIDTSQPGAVADFVASWDTTPYLTSGLTIRIDTARSGSWEEIDAIQLRGNPLSAVPEPGSWTLMAAGVGLLLWRRRRASRLGTNA
jgi:hypothetical protein